MKPRRPKATEATQSPPATCPLCRRGEMVSRRIQRVFEYGVGDLRVPVSAAVDSLVCSSCEACIDTPVGASEMEDAGRRAIGMLVGEDFRMFREHLRLSLRDMSRMTGIGTATLSRWESGRLRPNRSLDLLIRILRDVRGAAAYAMDLAKMPATKQLVGDSAEPRVASGDIIRCQHTPGAKMYLRPDRSPTTTCPMLAAVRVA